MKNIRHTTIRNTAIAIVALAGLAVATTACFGNSSTENASKALDATIEAVADQPESADKVESPAAVSSVSVKVESPTAPSSTPSAASPSTATPSTGAPASPEAAAEIETAPATTTPATEAPETEADPSIETGETEAASPETAPETAPSTTAPTTTTPATPSTPTLVMSPTIRFVTFAQDGMNIDSSILVEEGGAGRNDIVSVEMSYTKFGVSRTVAATQASSTTTSSLWLIDGLMLRVGDTVTIHAVDSRGNTDDTTATVELSTSMG